MKILSDPRRRQIYDEEGEEGLYGDVPPEDDDFFDESSYDSDDHSTDQSFSGSYHPPPPSAAAPPPPTSKAPQPPGMAAPQPPQSVIQRFHNEIVILHIQNVDRLLRRCIRLTTRNTFLILILPILWGVERRIQELDEHPLHHQFPYVLPSLKLLLLWTRNSLVTLVRMEHIMFLTRILTTSLESSSELKISARLRLWRWVFFL